MTSKLERATIETCWQDYATCWSADPKTRREAVERAVAQTVSYRDPHQEARGLDALLGAMDTFRTQMPEHAFAIDKVAFHHGRSLAHWRLLSPSGQVRMTGTSAATHDETGRLLDIAGFFEQPSARVLRAALLVTSHGRLGDSGRDTGLWLDELASPYAELTRAGCEVVIASPKGGACPIDPGSRSGDFLTEGARAFEADPRAMQNLKDSRPIAALLGDFDVVFLVGGHGTMWDFPDCAALGALLAQSVDRGAVIAAVCHGVAGLLAAPRLVRETLVRGRALTGFSDAEESLAGAKDAVPFLLEARLRDEGAHYSSGAPFGVHVVQHAKLITGQNPASATATAKLALTEAQSTLLTEAQSAGEIGSA